MIEAVSERLWDYGIAGIFIVYLIYDKQVTQKGLKVAIQELTKLIREKL